MEESHDYFELLARLGMTKHMGSMEATRRLVELCHLEPGQLVLEVGCGAGATLVYLVRERGCRVVGTDLLQSMIQQSRGRAASRGIKDQIDLAAADARALPFRSAVFDAVIMESLNVFFEEKLEAIQGYMRVTKPGGYVGLTEMTWLRPPTPERAAYYRQTVYADTLQAEGWIELLEEAGLRDVVGHAQAIDVREEARGRVQRYGCSGMVRVMVNAVLAFVGDRAAREFLTSVTRSVPRDVTEDVGYGVFVGRRP